MRYIALSDNANGCLNTGPFLCNLLCKHIIVGTVENHNHDGQSQVVIRSQDLRNTKHR
jgi:hypothetical protein